MKKFRLAVRLTFIAYIIVSLLIGMNDEKLIKEGFYFFWGKGVFTFYQNMKIWGLAGLIIISLQFITDNVRIFGLKRRISSKDAEIVQLKAQLFDQKEPEKTETPAVSDTTKPESGAATGGEVSPELS